VNATPLRACRLLFRLALLTAPSEFRRTYEARMVDALIEAVTESYRRDGWVGATFACLAGCYDGMRASIAERGETIVRDLAYAARSLARTPTTTFVSIAAIALAIGANLVVASVLDGVLLRPLPFAEAGHLLFVQESTFGHAMSFPDARSLAARIQPYAQLALSNFETQTLFGGGQSASLTGSHVSPNYFSVLGVRPALGRFFTAQDASSTNVVISYALWQTRFARDPAIVGQAIRLDDRDYTIVGVSPAGFRDPTTYGFIDRAYWIAIDPHDSQLAGPGEFNYNGIARLRSGFDVATGTTNIRAALVSLVNERGTHSPPCCPDVSGVKDSIVGPVRPLLWSLYALVCTVLVIACANVANLQYTRIAARESEFALRAALGASSRRLAAELMTETSLLVGLGAIAGLSLVPLGLTAFAQFGVHVLPRWENVGVDRSLYLYALALVALATLLAGIVPAVAMGRDLAARLASSHTTVRRTTKRARAVLVILEVALATSLVISAGLVVRSALAFTHVTYGFDAQNVFVVRTNLTPPHYASDRSELQFAERATERLLAIPGVDGVAASSIVPLACCNSQGVTLPGQRESTSILYDAVSPTYFKTLRIPLLRGRTFDTTDRTNARCTAIVDATFAQRYFSRSSVLGAVIKTSGLHPNCTIVGVVGAVREGFGIPLEPMLYLAMSQSTELEDFVIRASAPNLRLADDVAGALAKVDPTLPRPDISSFETIRAESTLAMRASAALFGSLAVIALLLALSGIYAVTAFTVERRTQEFGIRRAIGASTTAILRDVLGAAIAQCCVGVALGIVLTSLFARILAGLLYETSPFDAATFVAAIVLFLTCGIVAALLPAIEATRVEPAVALRRG
jgi:predicted permease